MQNEQIARGIGPQRIDIAYRRIGQADHPPVLLIMGLAAQLVHWPAGFLDALLAQRLQLILFDNRDSGLSTHFTDSPAPDFAAAMRGDFRSAPYTLADMAADAAALLDFLGIRAAHVLGLSMGGAIAQHLALDFPGHVLSLTSMMASTGNLAVGQMHPAAREALFGAPPPLTRGEAIERTLQNAPVVRSPAYPPDAVELALRTGEAWDRDHDAAAPPRQGIAALASGDRTERLHRLSTPALVIHGAEDRLCDVSGGRAVAAAIPGAQLLVYEGMGHDLPAELWSGIAARFAGLVRDAAPAGRHLGR